MKNIFAIILMLISLTTFAQQQPSRAKTYLDSGDRYYASQQFNQALPYYNEARRLALSAPQDVQVLLSLSHRYLAYRDEATAWDCYDKGTNYAYAYVNQNPQWSRYWLNEAVKYYNEQLVGLMNQAGTSQTTRTAIYNRALWVRNFLSGNTNPPPDVTRPPITTLPPSVGGTSGTNWSTNAKSSTLQIGQRYSCNCPANGNLGSIWGTDVYTDDTSICTAAVHAGVITQALGGTVIIEMRAGQTSYASSARYGVTSTAYGQWGRSFVFVR
ncbi:MAG: hypothetical protein JST84_15155 [Acidobacteria bacterium]|nr:hypothetical protein [Acidobacteriota bacterium]